MNAPKNDARAVSVWRTPPLLVPLAIVAMIAVYAVVKHVG